MYKIKLLTLSIVMLTAGAAWSQGGKGMGGSTRLTTFETDDFTGSGNCSVCHSNRIDSTGADVSTDAQWRSTTMANAAKDPLWQAKISSEIARNPALKSIIEDKCSRCHMPMARVQAVTDGTPVGVFDSGFLNTGHYLHEAAMDGVSCSICHQITSEGLGSPSSFSGRYSIDTSTNWPDRLTFGSFADPFQSPMQTRVGYTAVAGPHINLSEYCATCHMLYTPVVNESGTVIGEFPEQTPFLEWLHSDYAPGGNDHAECQICHMPYGAGSVALSGQPAWLEWRFPVGQHQFVGGNAFLIDILLNHGGELGVTAEPAHLNATKSLALDLLQTQTATMAVAGKSLSSGVLTVTLNVQNDAGHKFPTGIPLRRAWIHLMITDKHGRMVFESGMPNTDGSISGNNADLNGADYEPHYDLITSPDQVQIYEPIMVDSQGNVTYTFLRAAAYAKDNRLLPDGFSKGSAGPDIAVYGLADADADFIGGSDQITYQVGVNQSQRPFTVTARLLYHAVSYRAVQDLAQNNTMEIDRFVGYFNTADKMPETIAMTQVQIP